MLNCIPGVHIFSHVVYILIRASYWRLSNIIGHTHTHTNLNPISFVKMSGGMKKAKTSFHTSVLLSMSPHQIWDSRVCSTTHKKFILLEPCTKYTRKALPPSHVGQCWRLECKDEAKLSQNYPSGHEKRTENSLRVSCVDSSQENVFSPLQVQCQQITILLRGCASLKCISLFCPANRPT